MVAVEFHALVEIQTVCVLPLIAGIQVNLGTTKLPRVRNQPIHHRLTEAPPLLVGVRNQVV